MAFSDDLKAFAEKTKANVHTVVRTVVLEVDRSLVEKSPVGDPELWARPGNAPPGYVGGRFRANWQYGENTIPSGELHTPIFGPFPNATDCMSAVAEQVAPDAGGKIHYLVNNLPYAVAIEEGHSAKQAPAGVVEITVIEFRAIVDAAVKSL